MKPIKFRVWHPIAKKLELINGYGSADEGVFTLDRGEVGDIIEQSTGLFDKNDKEIFEGDILTGNRIVEWDEQVFEGYYSVMGWGLSNGYDESFSQTEAQELKIIGNIHGFSL